MNHVARTSLLSFGLLVGSASLASADGIGETLVHDTTTAVEIDLNAMTVLCSAADYSGTFLKVGMPELAALTLLDHQNIGANAPCVAAGACVPGGLGPDTILDPADPTELVHVRVRAVRQDVVDTAANTCSTWLIERVNVDIRGLEFTHERYAELGSRRVEDCATATPAGAGSGSGGKADGATSAEVPEAGGCSTAPGAGGSSLMVLLGALVTRRRRAKRA